MATVGKGRHDLDDIIGLFYEAAVLPEQWPDALDALADLLGARAIHLMYWDVAAQRVAFSAVGGLVDPEAERPYIAYDGAIDPRRPVSNQATGEMMCLAEDDESFIRCSEFYHDVLLPFDLRYVMCTSLRPRGNIIPTIGIHRSPAQGGFDGAHIEILRRVVRHLGKVVTLQQAKLERERIEALAGKEACPFALFVTNALGKLLFANPLAEELLLAGEGMKLRGGHLGAEDPKDAARLHGAINAAVPTARVRSKAVGTALRIRRSAGRQPLLALVGPLAASRLTALPPEPLAIVLVSDPERRPMLIGKHLMEWFGLTAAEAQLALRLAEGYRLEDVAVERDIRLSTLRSQLSAILGKTNTDRQSALVGLLSRLPANPRSAGQTGAAANRGADYG